MNFLALKALYTVGLNPADDLKPTLIYIIYVRLTLLSKAHISSNHRRSMRS